MLTGDRIRAILYLGEGPEIGATRRDLKYAGWWPSFPFTSSAGAGQGQRQPEEAHGHPILQARFQIFVQARV